MLSNIVRNATKTATGGLPVSGSALWLDASQQNTLFTDAGTTPVTTSGQSIYQWNDLSGNSRHAIQATSGNRPTWLSPANGQNSLGLADFNGTSSYVSVAIPFSTPYTVVIALKMTRNTQVDRILNATDLSTSTTRLWLGSYLGNYGGQVSTASGSWNGGALTYSPTTSIYNTFLRLYQTNSGTSTGLVPYVSGVALTGVQGAITSFTNLIVGAGPASQYGRFTMGELIIYPSVLGSTDLTAIGTYLQSKWSIL
jgi:hypothetical protein